MPAKNRDPFDLIMLLRLPLPRWTMTVGVPPPTGGPQAAPHHPQAHRRVHVPLQCLGWHRGVVRGAALLEEALPEVRGGQGHRQIGRRRRPVYSTGRRELPSPGFRR